MEIWSELRWSGNDDRRVRARTEDGSKVSCVPDKISFGFGARHRQVREAKRAAGVRESRNARANALDAKIVDCVLANVAN